jgi:hypothetical protein
MSPRRCNGDSIIAIHPRPGIGFARLQVAGWSHLQGRRISTISFLAELCLIFIRDAQQGSLHQLGY